MFHWFQPLKYYILSLGLWSLDLIWGIQIFKINATQYWPSWINLPQKTVWLFWGQTIQQMFDLKQLQEQAQVDRWHSELFHLQNQLYQTKYVETTDEPFVL